MKKTTYKVMSSCTLDSSKETWKRVYVDEAGNRHVKTKGGFKCIENTPCIKYMVAD